MSKIIEGNLPLTIENQNTEKINNYQIYGKTETIQGVTTGVGEQTENLFDITNTMFACGYGGNFINDNVYVDFSVDGNNIEIIVKETSHSAYVLLGFCESGSIYTVTASVTPTKDWGVYATNNTQLPISFSDTLRFVNLLPRSQDASKTFTVSQGLNYIWISTGAGSKYTVNISNIMLTSGSTAPDHYIPYGYQIPLTVSSGATENGFPFAEAGTFKFGNGTVVSDGAGRFTVVTSANSHVENSALIPLVKQYTIPPSQGHDGEYIFYVGNSDVRAGLSVVFYDSNGNKIENWLCNSVWRIVPNYLNMTGSTIAYIGFNIVANRSVAETVITPMFSKDDGLASYIPYRYSTATPIYIGDSKLMAEEYVDYESGKVYKRTENLLRLDRTKSRTFTTDTRYYLYGGLADGVSMQPQNIVSADINEDYVEVHSKTGAGIGYMVEVNPNTTYTVSYNLDISVSDDKSSAALNTISNYDVLGSFVGIYGNSNKYTITTLQNTKYLYIVLRVVGVKAKYTNITLTEGSTVPETYTPYLQPTDPPVALPEISLYKGTNTLSSTAEVGKVIIDYSVPEVFKVQLENQLYNLIDTNFYNMIANSYNSSSTYNEGDYCIYNYQLYKCISAISIPEDFDSKKWSQVTLAESLRGD